MSIHSNHNMHWLVFSDLDGTLLNEQSYSFAAAVPALKYLAENQIPLVLCTSKTKAEVAAICRVMKLDHPFIVENGSAVYIPKNYFHHLPDKLHSNGSYDILKFGKSFSEIRSFFDKLKKKFSIPAQGFRDMKKNELMKMTGLKEEEIVYAQNRKYSEPFILTDPFQFGSNIFDYAGEQGFRLLRGNRFYHLLGDTDKGRAVKALRLLFERNSDQPYPAIGIGDSLNDLEMFQVVDQPVLVKKQNGTYSKINSIQNLFRTEGIGPVGWQEAIFKFLLTEEIK